MPTAWQPLLLDPAARRARESVERVAESLLREVRSAPASFDLPAGGAGFTLALAQLSECLDRPDLLEAARTTWNAALDDLAQRLSMPGLHGGFTGTAWVAAHLQRQLFDDFEDDSVHEEIESTLVAHLEAAPRYENYDLISGSVGIGVYALERWPRGLAPRLLALVVDRLVGLGEPAGNGITWTTSAALLPAHQRRLAPLGYRNLGLAHGIPGIIALLAGARRLDALSDDGVHALEGGVTWLLDNQQPLVRGLRYPSWIPLGNEAAAAQEASRVAWCYGDLGVAAALLVAGTCHGREDWSSAAVQLARGCAAVPAQQSGVRDAGLCHGAAGVAHLFARLANSTGDALLAGAARDWLGMAMDMRRPDIDLDGYAAYRPRHPEAERVEDMQFEYVRDAGVLTGASGVALALSAGFSRVEPTWDRMLLVSVRPAPGRRS